ncbi:UNVERIFIED_CONTAM: putative exonuclease domain-containing protein [Sesamum calycinum]|uniref:Exonuclease domain-containing protein n=1 Tax=Sesamum calycinum TaxID=2727403 RepID=A0AAW2Q4J3_9LAMI
MATWGSLSSAALFYSLLLLHPSSTCPHFLPRFIIPISNVRSFNALLFPWKNPHPLLPSNPKFQKPVETQPGSPCVCITLKLGGAWGKYFGVKESPEQEFDYFLVLDLEGKVEILEFPVLLFDVKTMDVVDAFHRFVRPTKMSERRINEYIEGKYGKFWSRPDESIGKEMVFDQNWNSVFGIEFVWHDTAIKFEEVIEQFETWLRKERDGHIKKLWREEGDGRLNRAAFVTCGNWDLKTKVPQQCEVSRIKLPPYFMEWINLKDIYLNFYERRAPGMLSMMRELRIPPLGSHHLGIDDSKNIARVLRHLLTDGALLQITARRADTSPERVRFLFQNRIK